MRKITARLIDRGRADRADALSANCGWRNPPPIAVMPSRSTGTVKATISASPSPEEPLLDRSARAFWLEAYGGRRYLVERVKLPYHSTCHT